MLGGVVLNGLLGDPEQHGARILEFDMSENLKTRDACVQHLSELVLSAVRPNLSQPPC